MKSIVTPNPRKGWSRLLQMSSDELRTRIGQEAGKRIDLLRSRIGLQRLGNNLPRGEKAMQGLFFFSRQDLETRTALLKQHLDSVVTGAVLEADEILRHRFQLLGHEYVDYGPNIDWHLDAVHGKRAPRKPWFKVRFLDFSEVGDHKITWELNRHQHFVTLAKAWRFTQESKYVDELVRQWYEWQAANPYPIGINWSSSLEVAFRSMSWLWVRHLLLDCPTLPTTFQTDILRGLAFNARYIERYLSTYFSPNTHLLGEALALFFIGAQWQTGKSALRWRDLGWSILHREAQRQVHADGVYFEQSLYYHVYALDILLYARLLAAGNQLDVPDPYDLVLQKMLRVLSAISQIGSVDGFGDDDGGRLFNPRRNRSEHLTDPLSIGALLFRQDDSKSARALTEESVWLFGEAALDLKRPLDIDVKVMSSAFESGGIYIMASAENNSELMMIDAGPQGTSNSGHGHADALSVRLSADRRNWLVDAGTCDYMSEERDLFRGTGSHNTLRVDGVDQAIPAGPFAWRSIPTTRRETWITGETFDLFTGSHNGYARLTDPVVHRRFVFHLHGAFWLVRDVAEGREVHKLETFWHFASDLCVTCDGGIFIAGRAADHLDESRTRLSLLPVEDSNWMTELTTGYVSSAYGHKEVAAVVQSRAEIQLPAEHALLLKLLAPHERNSGHLSRLNSVERGVCSYRYDENGKSHFIIFAQSELQAWECCGFSGDARFLYACTDEGHLTHIVLCYGKTVSFNGHPVIGHSREIARYEWFTRDGISVIRSSEEGLKNSFSGNVVGMFG